MTFDIDHTGETLRIDCVRESGPMDHLRMGFGIHACMLRSVCLKARSHLRGGVDRSGAGTHCSHGAWGGWHGG